MRYKHQRFSLKERSTDVSIFGTLLKGMASFWNRMPEDEEKC
jgi:hypothetical protein